MNEGSLDVLLAVYLIPDLAQQDYDALIDLVHDEKVTSDGVVLVKKDADGEIEVVEAGDHMAK